MDRFLVPRLGIAAVLGLATLLIGVIVLRGPDTHGNLWGGIKAGYARTEVATLGGKATGEHATAKVAFAMPSVSLRAATPMDPGRAIYLGRGCGTCHGVDARGGAVGPSVAGAKLDTLEHMVRDGPGGMPTYTEAQLNKADLEKLATYLQGLTVVKPSPAEIAAIQNLSWDPSVPPSALLQGKAAIRRSCGACHAQPGREDIRAAFPGDYDATSLVAAMVRTTNLNLQDARSIAYYMMAVLHDADPVNAS
ncbi:MAG: c-type cytochrome [Chloroflexi bacterium]|nr:c-type cytochrome [Chloroflexota bacterium]